MASTFVNTLQDQILDLSKTDPAKLLHMFTARTNEAQCLKAAYDAREGLMSESSWAAISNTRSSDQATTVEYYNKIAPGAGATRVRQGTGGGVTANITPTYLALVEEGFDTSFVNAAIRQYMQNDHMPKGEAIRKAYTDDFLRVFAQKVRNIYTRLSVQVAAYLEANHWVLTSLADAGTQYTTYTGDAKNIPLADFTSKDIIQKLRIEARQNNFLQFGNPMIVGSATTERIVQKYMESGANNSIDVAQFQSWFDPYFTNEIVDSTSPAHISTFFLMPRGAIGATSRAFPWKDHPQAVNGVVNKGNDSWTNLVIGGEMANTLMFGGLPRIEIEVKGYGGYADTSGTYTINESVIDIIENISLVAQIAVEKAPDVTNASPIIKHVVLAA